MRRGCDDPTQFPTTRTIRPKKHLATLNVAIGDVQGKVTAINQLTKTIEEPAGETGLTIRAKEDVRVAHALLDTARTTFQSGTTLNPKISNAGHVLISAVDRIGAMVDAAIVETEPDIASLPGLINGLAQTSMQLTKIPESEKSVDQLAGADTTPEAQALAQETDEGKLNKLLDKLKVSAVKLSNETLRVASVVNTVSETEPSETLKQCGVEVEKVDTGITSNPMETSSLFLVQPRHVASW